MMRKDTVGSGGAGMVMAALVMLAGCGPDPGKVSGSGYRPGDKPRTGGNPGANPSAGDFDVMFSDKPPVTPGGGISDEAICKLKEFNLQREPPELLLVLDRSGSMRRDASGKKRNDIGFYGMDKWDETTGALDQVIKETQDGILWGLKIYPTKESICEGERPPLVDPALGTHGAIMANIAVLQPPVDQGATPTRFAVQTGGEYLKARNSPRPKYLLVATDGMPNCADHKDSNQDHQGAIDAVRKVNQELGIPVIVVGIAVDIVAHDSLVEMAKAGGMARSGEPSYYSVRHREDLVAALGEIAGQIASCTFQLGEAPPVPEEVAVDVGGMRVPPDPSHSNGWDFGDDSKKSVVLYGEYCAMIKDGNIKDAAIKWTCPGEPIP